jgi:UDP-N-acetyl-D-mannosaminuronic acid dehydrogenase
MPKLVVVGMGYVGIPVACAFASKGLDVVGIDIVKEKVEKLNHGELPLSGEEPGLPDLLKKVVEDGKLKASLDFSECQSAQSIIICVETPLHPMTKKPDTRAIESAISAVGKNLERGTLVSIESTIAPLTTNNVIIPILEKESRLKAGKDFHLVHCPERLMAGRLLYNLEKYDRVIGGIDRESTEMARKLYGVICKGALHFTDCLTAEVVKTTENTYRDVQIAFANEIALICHELGINAYEVRKLVNTCPFRDMHAPGPGVGGHCIPKDPLLLLSSIEKYDSKIIKSARVLNDSMPLHVLDLIEDALSEVRLELENSVVALLGLAYLENTGDTRNSPSIVVWKELERRGAKARFHDPYASFEGIGVSRSLDDVLKGADCAVLLTPHKEYGKLDFGAMGKLMKNRTFIDCSNQYGKDEVSKSGFVYRALGKPRH